MCAQEDTKLLTDLEMTLSFIGQFDSRVRFKKRNLNLIHGKMNGPQ